jgi:heme exporter protein D
MNASSWLAMGGYGFYIWTSYGVAIVLLLGLLVASLRGLRRIEAEVEAAERRTSRRSRKAER